MCRTRKIPRRGSWRPACRHGPLADSGRRAAIPQGNKRGLSRASVADRSARCDSRPVRKTKTAGGEPAGRHIRASPKPEAFLRGGLCNRRGRRGAQRLLWRPAPSASPSRHDAASAAPCVPNRLDRLREDQLAPVDLEALALEELGDVGRGDRAVQLIGLADAAGDHDLDGLDAAGNGLRLRLLVGLS